MNYIIELDYWSDREEKKFEDQFDIFNENKDQ